MACIRTSPGSAPRDLAAAAMTDKSSQDLDGMDQFSITQDQSWQPMTTLSLQLHPDSTENSLLAQTLRMNDGVRTVRTYIRRSDKVDNHNVLEITNNAGGQVQRGKQQQQDQSKTEVAMIFSLGRGVNGIADTCHGSIVFLILDEVTGQLAAEVFGRNNVITADLSVTFRRRIQTPSKLLCRAWLPSPPPLPPLQGQKAVVMSATSGTQSSGQEPGNSVDGKKMKAKRVKVEGQIEDVTGQVYARGSATFAWIDRSKL